MYMKLTNKIFIDATDVWNGWLLSLSLSLFFFFFLNDERDRDVIEDIIENGTALEEVDEDKDEDENEDEDAEETTVSTIPLVKMGKMIQ